MCLRIYLGTLILAVGATIASGQSMQRKATFLGGGGGDRGKCTVEVVVDGAAEVDIRGDVATLRNLNGQFPQWRRFECTGPLPPNPAGFRFAGVDGRGRQDLVRAPGNGNPAVVRIEDPDGGVEGYTFDIFWGGRGGFPDDSRGGFRDDRRGPGPGRRYTVEQATDVCKDAVRQQAAARFGFPNIVFGRTRLEDNPDRRDWISGEFEVRRSRGDELFRFSCSVDFDNGRVRSAQIDPMPGGRPGYDRGRESQALESCRRAVGERVRNDGYFRVSFGSIRMDDRPGRNDWIVGTVNGDRRDRSTSFDFSCSVNMDTGVVRSVEVKLR